MLEGIREHLTQLSADVSQAILNDEFEVLERDAYKITIMVFESKIEIWNANTPEYTRIWRIESPYFNCMDLDVDFPNPAECREKLRSLTEEEKRQRQREIQDEINRLKEEANGYQG